MRDKFYYSDGSIFDYQHPCKTLHREDGPAIEYADGDKIWYLNGKYHREEGPAVEYPNGDKAWYFNGELHREDGPAIERSDGKRSWYLNGVYYTEEEYNKLAPQKALDLDFDL